LVHSALIQKNRLTGGHEMGYLVMTVLESDAGFQQMMAETAEEDRGELELIKEGLNKRRKFMSEHSADKWLWFEKTSDKLDAIEEWYPRAYRILEKHMPNLVKMPNDMGYAVLKLADDFVQHLLLPADQNLLRLSI